MRACVRACVRVSMRAFVCDDLLSKFIAFKPLLVWVADNSRCKFQTKGIRSKRRNLVYCLGSESILGSNL